MPRKKNKVGRPPKVIGKLTRSINLKLSEMDYANLLTKAEKLNITPTAYARHMVVSGYVRAPYTEEHLELLCKIAGEANNINQIAKHLNAGRGSYRLYAIAMVEKLKKIIDDSKKY